jgi:hypothetical protein
MGCGCGKVKHKYTEAYYEKMLRKKAEEVKNKEANNNGTSTEKSNNG